MKNIANWQFSVFLAVNSSNPVSQLQVLETRAHCEHFIAEGIDISTLHKNRPTCFTSFYVYLVQVAKNKGVFT